MSDKMEYYAPQTLGKSRSMTPEQFLLCKDVAIARTGSQLYRVEEINSTGDGKPLEGDTDGHILVERTPDEVFHPDTMASFEGKPVTVEHPNEFVTPDTWRQLAVGHVQNVRRGTGIEDDLLLGDILITVPEAIKYVNEELPELSCGYDADYEAVNPGHAIQRNILGNHVALVDRGRAGPRVAIRDDASILHQLEILKMANRRRSRFVDAVVNLISAVHTKDAQGAEAAAEELEAAHGTGDAETPEEKERKEMKDALDGLRKDMKGIRDWQEGYDKKTKDAEATAAEEKKERERKEAEDALLEAEPSGHKLDLGKTWTGDSAAPALRAIVARAEVLSPGIAVPTTDAVGVGVRALMRNALEKFATTDIGKEVVPALLGGRTLDSLKGGELYTLFNGAHELARRQNNEGVKLAPVKVRTTDFGSKVASGADINQANQKFWAERSAR